MKQTSLAEQVIYADLGEPYLKNGELCGLMRSPPHLQIIVFFFTNCKSKPKKSRS
ncbi:MAG: hypothetical protein WA828_20870 [Coleofasciculaceae cyanobacterium]